MDGTEQVTNDLENIFESMFYIKGIAQMGIWGILLTIAIVGVIVSLVISLILFILEAIPVFILARKTGRKSAWLAWIPILGRYFRLYVISDIPGMEELKLFGDRLKLSRPISFWIYIGLEVFGSSLIKVIAIVINIIPGLGQLLSAVMWIINLLPNICCAIIEYQYLKDILDIFKEDKKKNNVLAIVLTVLDATVTLGFARTVCLYTLIRKKPIPMIEIIN
ncbi:MAG: hypothetical protein E7266_03550 [Lachnospiraceae bacterium]|nr:hypothetical protein [Lachnospiraceae bacterium]